MVAFIWSHLWASIASLVARHCQSIYNETMSDAAAAAAAVS